ncbi:hypothetical protein DQ04_06341040 [Trypanosoma grayi]|uniref:hypothetical protein n=1 Tax=Trypanosoma grayi TaxID=71804 RepID=UPI0004F3FA73|nr:hypothetical protein DQ04_06341040 [Trypanosoma grayi]KEG08839.1 hypothetical protein DQ04_06341040 [Trypanosoma grayi]
MQDAHRSGDAAAATDALQVLQVDLLQTLHEQKKAVLALEAQRLLFLERTAAAEVLAACLAKEQLLRQMWWKKQLFLVEANLTSRVLHQRLIRESRRAANGKGTIARLEVCSPLLRLDVDKGESEGERVVGSGSAVVEALVVPLNCGIELQCRLIVNSSGNEKYDADSDEKWLQTQKQQDSYFEEIRRVPFVLTYVAGNAALSEHGSTLAYAQRETGGNDGQMVAFPDVALDHAEANSVHTLLITHPRTQHSIIPPLEVAVVAVASPSITLEAVTHIEAPTTSDKKDSMSHSQDALQRSDAGEMGVRVAVGTDEIVTRIVLECHEQCCDGKQTHCLGKAEVRGKACEELLVGEGRWRFSCCIPIESVRSTEVDVNLLLLKAQVTLASMPQQTFRETFHVASTSQAVEGRVKIHAEEVAPTVQNGGSEKKEVMVKDAQKDTSDSGIPAQGDTALRLYSMIGEDSRVSTEKQADDESCVAMSSFRLDDDGVLGIAPTSDTSASVHSPHLVYCRHTAPDSIANVQILGLEQTMREVTSGGSSSSPLAEWVLEPCGGAPPWFLLRDPRGGCVVLRWQSSGPLRAETCFCYFPPPLHDHGVCDDARVVEQLFVEPLECIVRRLSSGRVTCTSSSSADSTVLVENAAAACVWLPGDEEVTSLVVVAQRGCCFSVYSLDDNEVLLHSSLQVNAHLADVAGEQEYLGVTPVRGGDAVLLWTATTVEMLSHAPSWTRELVYTTESLAGAHIMALCPVHTPPLQKKDETIFLFLLLSDGSVVGLAVDGSVHTVGHLSSSAPSSLTAADLPHVTSLMMRHVMVNEKSAVCICGLTENHVLRRAYVY